MTHLSYRAEITSRFRDLLVRHGLYRSGMGLYVIRDLQTLAATGPMAAIPTARARETKAPLDGMGRLIKEKLAIFDPHTKSYDATPAGRDWLAQMQAKGLLMRVADAIRSIEAFKEANP